LYLDPAELEKQIDKTFETYEVIKKEELMYETYHVDSADIIIVAYGTTSRIVKNVIHKAEEKGLKIGLIRPITLWPFPYDIINEYAEKKHVKALLSVEMSKGQMIEDVRLSVSGKKPVFFTGRTGGMVPTPNEILDKINEIMKEVE